MQKTDIHTLYSNYSTLEKEKLVELQELIHEVAREAHVEINEGIKWGQLSFASPKGTPIRIDKYSDTQIGFFVHCQTTLVETWRSLFADTLCFSKNRAILLELNAPLPKEALKICIDHALNYHSK